MVAGLAEDFRFAFRMLRKNPGTTLAAMTALAFGIGFNAATYSTADVLVFRPLLIPEIERAVALSGHSKARPDQMLSMSPAEFQRWRESLRSVEALTAMRSWRTNLTGGGEPEMLEGQRVSASFFAMAALQPILGRGFSASEEPAGADRVVVLSHGLWDRRFGRDPDVVGREIQLDGAAYRVIGVMPEHFQYPVPVQLWAPLGLTPEQKSESGNFFLRVSGRLKPGATIDQLRAELPGLSTAMRREFAGLYEDREYRAVELRNVVSGDMTRDYTMVVLGCVGFLLLIACANVANLQMARMLARTREMSIRTALGAVRLRLIRQVLVESLLLAVGGMAIGLVIAVWCLDLIRSAMPAEVMRFLPGWQRMGLNPRVLLWTMGVTCAAALLSGLAPAIWMTRRSAATGIRAGDRGSSGASSRHRINAVLVTSEIMLSLILLVGAVLMARGLNRIGTLPPGVPVEQLLTFRIPLPVSRYADDAAVRRFQADLTARLRALPGALAAGQTLFLPYADDNASGPFAVEGVDYGNRLKPIAVRQIIDPGFLRAFGLGLKRGRAILASDGADSQRVALVSEKLAEDYFRGRDPIGRQLQWNGTRVTVVGVVEDVRQEFIDRSPRPTIYTSAAQFPERSADFVVRTVQDPLQSATAVRATVAAIDPMQPVFQLRTMRKLVNDSITGITHTAVMLSVLGLVALVLSSVGVYSLMAWSVGERTREMGIRLALGAMPGQVMWAVLRRTAGFVCVGVVVGLAGSVAMARLLSGLIYGIAPGDLFTFTCVPAVLLTMTLIACVVPARRALRTDPVKALHYE